MTRALSLAEAWRRLFRRHPADLAAVVAGEHAEVLAAYSALSSKLSELERQKRRLRRAVDAIPAGEVFGGWRKRFGEPAEIVDKEAVEADFAGRGLAVPKKNAAAPVVVEYVGDRHDMREGSDR